MDSLISLAIFLLTSLLLPRYWRTSCGHGVESPALLKPLSHLGVATGIAPVAALKLMVLWGASLACFGGGELPKLFTQ